jgi:phospholipid/cholesterol/gamma-HCH transport system permease protein
VCSELAGLDTTGAAVVVDAIGRGPLEKNIIGLSEDELLLLRRIAAVETDAMLIPVRESIVTFIGRQTILLARQLLELVGLLGMVVMVIGGTLKRPRRFRFAELMTQLYSVCLMAVGVVSLVTFLIGVVVAYLFSLQAVQFGVNVYVVDGVGQAMLRELSPILVAVVLAGRTGSAFTAQIGAMRMNEELDALEMLGLSIYWVVVVPRILALVVAMPLLVFVGDSVGMLGAAMIGYTHLDISPAMFFDRFATVIPLKAYLIGLAKAPVFAVVIGLIASQMGLAVERNAQSLGLRTTSTVVQSIVAVIILNAIFAIICAKMGV